MKPGILTIFPLLALCGCVVAPQPTQTSQLGCVQTRAATGGQGASITCPQLNGTWIATDAPPSVPAQAQPPPPPQIYVPPPVIIAPPPVYAYPYGYSGYFGGGYYGGGYYGW